MSYFNQTNKLDLKNLLNESQYQAATYQGGPLLIVAGAGSGKTRTLVHRVAWLVDQGMLAHSILLLTFTRKAAAEMLNRCSVLTGGRSQKVSGGTFHSIANMLLRSKAHLLDYPSNFGIMDQDDSESIISRLRADLPDIKLYKKFPQKGAILNVISQSVNRDLSIDDIIKTSFSHFTPYVVQIRKLAQDYRLFKQKNALMDFDDLLVNLEKVMRENEEARQSIAGRYSYILVDEYQDTNPIQARLTHLLGKDHLNVTAVGDEAQSIYAFRGASFRNIMDFPNIFPGTKVLKLEDNYRSVKPVLVMANSILSKAKEKYDKKLQSVRGDGPKPQLVAVSDLSAEASFVYEQIQEALKKGVPLEEMAVLFRSASHSFELEVLLARKKVPFTKYGGRKFLETAHIKDFLSFLRLCSNASDSQSLMRVVGMLPGFGPKGSQDLANWVGGKWENLVNLKDAPVSAKSKEKLAPLSSLMSVIAQPGDDLKERVKLVSGYYGEMLSELYPDDYPQRESDLLELKRMAEEGVNLTSFLADLTLDPPNSSRSKQAFDQKKVDLTLSTIHSAKGMEWSQVFILSVLEGRFPSSYRVKTEDEVEEERRLMYVAVTRAKDRLFIMIPMVEPSYGYDNNYDIEPSRFLGGLPNGAAEVYKNGKSVKYKALWNDYDFEEYEEEKEDEVKKAKETKILLEDKKPIKKAVTNCQDNLKILVSRKVENEVIFIPEVGQRVIHPAFGSGQVVKMSEKKATIDFDRFGPKNVVIAFAHLVPEVKPSR